MKDKALCIGHGYDFIFQVNKYLENYERALSGFEAAASKDPGLNAGEEVQNIVHLLDKLESLLRVSTYMNLKVLCIRIHIVFCAKNHHSLFVLLYFLF